jgi:hypothetical protein
MSDKKCAMDTKEIIEMLCDIADQIGSFVGEKGVNVVFRQAGKRLGKKLGSGHKGPLKTPEPLSWSFSRKRSSWKTSISKARRQGSLGAR